MSQDDLRQSISIFAMQDDSHVRRWYSHFGFSVYCYIAIVHRKKERERKSAILFFIYIVWYCVETLWNGSCIFYHFMIRARSNVDFIYLQLSMTRPSPKKTTTWQLQRVYKLFAVATTTWNEFAMCVICFLFRARVISANIFAHKHEITFNECCWIIIKPIRFV